MSSHITTRVTTAGTLALDEAQMRALEALVGYGTEPFLKVFYEKLGKHYLEPHEDGLRRLFETIKRDIPPALARMDMVRKFIKDNE